MCVTWAAAEDAAAASLQLGKSVSASTGTQDNIDDRLFISIKESRESLSASWEVPQQPSQSNKGKL